MKTNRQRKLEKQGWKITLCLPTGNWIARKGNLFFKNESLKKLLDIIE